MSLIHSKMINVSIDPDKEITLSDIMSDGYITVPISMFGTVVSDTLIEDAITHMINNGGGEISVPIPDNYFAKTYKNFKVQVHRDSTGNFYTNYIIYSYRHPLGADERPYGGEWEIGDIVYNYDFKSSDSKFVGWVCTSKGIPGSWEPLSGTGSGGVSVSVEYGVLKFK